MLVIGHRPGGFTPFRRTGISLPEVLVVISLILFLLALLVPGLGAARERVRRLICANNLRQWGGAVHSYRQDHNDYLPQEGHGGPSGPFAAPAWYNTLPPYLDLPSYRDFEGVGVQIRERPNINAWICPSKNLTRAYKSFTGMNQFHYGMNQVLDGLGNPPNGSRDTPGFLDERDLNKHPSAQWFAKKPHTVLLFDIEDNSPAGTPRDVATVFQRDDWYDTPIGQFHGDYANLLYLDGAVGNCTTDDLVTDRDFEDGEIMWTTPHLYWGYPPP